MISFITVFIILICTSFTNTEKSKIFPFKEFFNIQDNEIFPSAQYLCSAQGFEKCCSCYSNCMWQKNCCIDKSWNATNPIPLKQYLETIIQTTDLYKDTTCEPIFPLGSSTRILMITKCSEKARLEDVNGCTNVTTDLSYEYNIPVLGSDNYIYKNIFCARCNFIDRFQIVNITGRCSSSTLDLNPPIRRDELTDEITTTTTTTKAPQVKLTDRFKGCFYEISRSSILNKAYYKSCYQDRFPSREKCLPTNKYYKLCNTYQSRMGAFANYHCYLCIFGDEDLSKRPPPDSCRNFEKSVSPVSWRFTISFSKQTNVNIEGPWTNIHESYCKDHELYNIFTGKCDAYACSGGYKKIENTCQKLPTIKLAKTRRVLNSSYDKCLLSENVALFLLLNTTANVTVLENLLNQSMNSTIHIKLIPIYSNATLVFIRAVAIDTQNTFDAVSNVLSNSKSVLWNHIQSGFIGNENQIVTELYGVDYSRTFSRHRICAIVNSNESRIYNHTQNCNVVLSNSTIHNDNISRWITFSRYSIKQKVSVCHKYHLQSSCKLTPVYSNYSIIGNQTLLVEERRFSVDEYVPLTNGIGVCIETHNNKRYHWQATVDDSNKYIMYIFTSISIVCYAVIVLTYIYFKELKTIPGLIITALCITLLVTDVLVLVSSKVNDHFSSCKVIGILLHWGLLSAQLWVVVMAFDLLSKFGSLAMTIGKNISKTISRYCIFVVISSTLIVGVSIILNEQNIYSFGYGENNVCFIYNLYPRIFFYIIPVCTCLLAVTFAFIYVIVVIKKQEDRTRKTLHSSGRKDNDIFMIALKLVLSLGLIEIIGFVQISKDKLTESEELFNATFATLYNLFRSCRGIVLFTLYMLTKDKYKLFRSKFSQSEEMVNFSNRNMNTKVSEVSNSYL